MAFDLLLIDGGSGSDFTLNKKGSDLVTVTGFQNMVYLALFGGNIEQSTKQYLVGEQRSDWWGNTALFVGRETAQMNSNTERLLRDISLTSQSRIVIEQQVKKDLKFMTDFSDVESSVSFIENDRVRIYVKLTRPNTKEIDITFIWNNTLGELENNQHPTL